MGPMTSTRSRSFPKRRENSRGQQGLMREDEEEKEEEEAEEEAEVEEKRRSRKTVVKIRMHAGDCGQHD